MTDIERCRRAAAQLCKSQRGTWAMRQLLAFLDSDGLSLDGGNRAAVLELLDLAWSTCPGSARDAMRDALDDGPIIV